MTDLVEALRLEGDRRVCEKEMTFGNSKSRADRIADDLCYQAASRISQQDAELERLRREVEELKTLFEQRWNTDLRAKKRWQDANPDKPNIWPSRDDLLVWLMDQHDEARKAAFIEAAEMASLSSSPSVYAFAAMIRAKAEGGNHG